MNSDIFTLAIMARLNEIIYRFIRIKLRCVMVVDYKGVLSRKKAMKLSTSLIMLHQRYLKITKGIEVSVEDVEYSIFNYEMLRFNGLTMSFTEFNNYVAFLDTHYLTGKELKEWQRIIGKDSLIVSYMNNLTNGFLNINLN